MNTTWLPRPEIAIDLLTPVENRFSDVPPEAIASCRKLVDSVTSELSEKFDVFADAVNLRTQGRFHDEAIALAKLLDVRWQDVMLANISYDLVLAQFGCSTLVLPTSDGPVIARNMDWWPEALLAESSYLLRCKKGDEPAYCNGGWLGAIGMVTGMSARGFAVILNAASGLEGVDIRGYPVLLHVRRVVEDAEGFDQALEMLSNQHLSAPGLFTLVGSENHQRVVIERTPRRHALRWGETDRPLITTNDYRVLFKESGEAFGGSGVLYETACGRYEALLEEYGGWSATSSVNDERLLTSLAHPRVVQEITAQHVLIRPRVRQMNLYVPARLLR